MERLLDLNRSSEQEKNVNCQKTVTDGLKDCLTHRQESAKK